MSSPDIIGKLARKALKRVFKRQAMAVCMRESEGCLQLLLVSKRSSRSALTFPKGTVEPGEAAADAARREAFEEAGVSEATVLSRIGAFYYWKKKRFPLIRVDVFQLRVEALAAEFPEVRLRERRWMTPVEAQECVRQDIWKMISSSRAKPS